MLDNLFCNYDSIIVFDVETSGLDPYKDQIVEIAAIRLMKDLQNNNQVKIRRLHYYVKMYGGRRISEEARKVNGLTEKALEVHGESIDAVLEHFADFIKGERILLIAHNANFDVLFIKVAAIETGKSNRLEKFDILDTLTVFKDRAPFPHKLSDAIMYYGLNESIKSSHGANHDAFALANVFVCMYGEKSDVEKYINLIGFNPKYPPKYKLPGVIYKAQSYDSYSALYN